MLPRATRPLVLAFMGLEACAGGGLSLPPIEPTILRPALDDAAIPAEILSDLGVLSFRSPTDPGAGYLLRRHARIWVRAPSGRSWGRVEVPLDAWSRLLAVKGSSARPDGEGRVTLDPMAVGIRSLALDAGLLYSDARLLMFDVPGVDVGDELEHETLIESDQSFALPGWRFQARAPVHESRFIVELPAGWELSARVLPLERASSVTKRVEVRAMGRSRWVFEAHAQEALEDERFAPPLGARALRVELAVARVQGRPFLATFDDLARWYHGQAPIEDPPSAQVAGVLAEIRRSGGSPEEEAIFRWVRDRLRYVAFYEALGAVAPHRPEDVLAVRFGDCKDLAHALVALYRASGRRADPVLVARRSAMGSFEGAPVGLGSFGHAIVALETQAGVRYLDPTKKTATFERLPWALEGLPAVVLRQTQGEVVRLPSRSAAINREERRWRLGRSASGPLRLQVIAGGATAEPWRASWLGEKGAPPLGELLAGLVGRSGARLSALAVAEEGPDQIRIDATLDVPGFVTFVGRDRLVPLAWLFSPRPELTSRPRRAPIELGPPRTLVEEVRVPLGANEHIWVEPQGASISFPGGRYLRTFEARRREVVVERTLTSTVEWLPAHRTSELQALDERLSADARLGLTITATTERVSW